MAKLVYVEWKLKPRKPTQTVFPQTNSHIWARFKTNLESKAAFLCREMLTPPPPPIICPRLQTPGGGGSACPNRTHAPSEPPLPYSCVV